MRLLWSLACRNGDDPSNATLLWGSVHVRNPGNEAAHRQGNGLVGSASDPEESTTAFLWPPRCYKKLDFGSCDSTQLKWYYYQPQIRGCKVFAYTGCDGSWNRFSSEKKCLQSCLSSTRQKQQHEPTPPCMEQQTEELVFLPELDVASMVTLGTPTVLPVRVASEEQCPSKTQHMVTEARETCRREYKRMEEKKRAEKAGQIPTISWQLPGSAEIPQGLLMPELGLGAPTLSLEGAMKVMKGGISNEAGQPSGLPQLPTLPETSPDQGKLKGATSDTKGMNEGPQEGERGLKVDVTNSLETPPSLKAIEHAAVLAKGTQASQPLGELAREPGKESVKNEIGGSASIKAPQLPLAEVPRSNFKEPLDKKGAPPQISRAHGQEVGRHEPAQRQQGAENDHHPHVILIALIKTATMSTLPEGFDQQTEGNGEPGEVPNGGPSDKLDLPQTAIK
ncbi:hypothetical protein HPB50_008489 [Hyalomma asiaticum]|uniref:Uncharacterized protein n=1 Tax=Hyalomma asiaticum TaxID=266040 RepID=A0ACB7RXQ1_HYAAI|nr:hypothetical protein HPB50_008489 [Hyalomma asiaticum]